MSSPRSPKRRKILSSINPPDHSADRDDKPSYCGRQRSPSEHDDLPRQAQEPSDTRADGSGAEGAPRVTKFRFKSKSHRRQHRSRDSSSRRHGHPRSPSPSGSTSPRKHHHHHHRRHRHHHRRNKRTTKSPVPSPPEEAQQDENPFSAPLDPDAAFRESLFDAMADDEGAAYWQTVYGQPIHVYAPPTRTNPQGELERMTDNEYAAHVRQKMWERTHAGLLEERAARERRRVEEEKKEEERRRIAEEMERSLRRGEERRRNKMSRGRWDDYVRRWTKWEGGGAGGLEGIPWPVGWKGTQGSEGEERDVKAEEETVRAFFVRGLGLEEVGEREFAVRLKDERVRWHPDKMQQRLGGTVDTAVMRDVTAIFQVIDGLWNDTRKGSG
ncbi:hypothetical protein B0T25DRAFT_516845 [Lasiosphaeria hispida]|uniref:J domain-containing protein n=1 Tax=Lasiosphaeria hispida TaxID=260671 RepID=A0AAJ0HM24_9PEZI|nr:hypothetical protein B0T25DRAFT_516845 [Lasiosphaeria hispida]